MTKFFNQAILHTEHLFAIIQVSISSGGRSSWFNFKYSE